MTKNILLLPVTIMSKNIDMRKVCGSIYIYIILVDLLLYYIHKILKLRCALLGEQTSLSLIDHDPFPAGRNVLLPQEHQDWQASEGATDPFAGRHCTCVHARVKKHIDPSLI